MIEVHGWWLPLQQYVILLCVATAFCLLFGFAAFRQLRQARWVEDTPTSLIRSAAQGLVELHGHCAAAAQPPLRSPLQGTACLWYRFTIEAYRRSGKHSRWCVVERGESERPFLLRDETGECWIDPRGAVVHPRQRRRWEGRSRWPTEPGQGTGWIGLALGERYRYTEEWFADGEALYALGWFESRGGGRDAVDESGIARRLIVDWKRDFQSLLARFDRNGDGQLDLAEWSEVRAAAALAAASETAALKAAPLVHSLHRPPHRGLPFVLSDHHENQLSGRLRRRALGSLAGMLLGGLAACLLWTALV